MNTLAVNANSTDITSGTTYAIKPDLVSRLTEIFYSATINWTSNDTSVATINKGSGIVGGKVTGHALGSAMITGNATSPFFTLAQLKIPVVIDNGATCRVTPPFKTPLGQECSIPIWFYIYMSSNGIDSMFAVTPINWSSSDNSIATIDSFGNVTGVSTGYVTINANASGPFLSGVG